MGRVDLSGAYITGACQYQPAHRSQASRGPSSATGNSSQCHMKRSWCRPWYRSQRRVKGQFLSRKFRYVVLGCVVGACVVAVPFLASNNLLPRRVFLHLLSLTCLVASFWCGRRALPPQWGLLAGLFLLVRLIGPTPEASLPGFLDALALVGVVVGVAGARLPRVMVVRWLVALCVAGAVFGLLEQWLPLEWNPATRPSSFFASRVTAGSMMVASLPLSCFALRRRAWVLGLVLVLQGVFLISTRTRIAWVAAVLVVTLVVIAVPRLRVVVASATALAAALASTFTPGPRLQWVSAAPYVASATSIVTLDVGDRLDVWRETLRLIAARPWGYGPGSFASTFSAEARLPESLHDVEVESPHNELLRVAYEGGVLTVALCLWAVWPKRRNGRGASTQTRFLQLSLLALLVCSMTGKTATDPPTAAFGALVLGLLLRAKVRPTVRPVRRGLALAVGALAVFTTLVDGRELVASKAFADAHALSAAGDFRAAWARVEPELSGDLPLSEWLWLATELADANDVPHCTDVLHRALAAQPRHPLLEAMRKRCSREAMR
jgi:O-antigen ligase